MRKRNGRQSAPGVKRAEGVLVLKTTFSNLEYGRLVQYNEGKDHQQKDRGEIMSQMSTIRQMQGVERVDQSVGSWDAKFQ